MWPHLWVCLAAGNLGLSVGLEIVNWQLVLMLRITRWPKDTPARAPAWPGVERGLGSSGMWPQGQKCGPPCCGESRAALPGVWGVERVLGCRGSQGTPRMGTGPGRRASRGSSSKPRSPPLASPHLPVSPRGRGPGEETMPHPCCAPGGKGGGGGAGVVVRREGRGPPEHGDPLVGLIQRLPGSPRSRAPWKSSSAPRAHLCVCVCPSVSPSECGGALRAGSRLRWMPEPSRHVLPRHADAQGGGALGRPAARGVRIAPAPPLPGAAPGPEEASVRRRPALPPGAQIYPGGLWLSHSLS